MGALATEAVRALSVRPPWSEWIVDGVKPIENRTWRPRWRGDPAEVRAITTLQTECDSVSSSSTARNGGDR